MFLVVQTIRLSIERFRSIDIFYTSVFDSYRRKFRSFDSIDVCAASSIIGTGFFSIPKIISLRIPSTDVFYFHPCRARGRGVSYPVPRSPRFRVRFRHVSRRHHVRRAVGRVIGNGRTTVTRKRQFRPVFPLAVSHAGTMIKHESAGDYVATILATEPRAVRRDVWTAAAAAVAAVAIEIIFSEPRARARGP